MQKTLYTKECFGSLLQIDVEGEQDIDSVIAESFSYVENFEQKYSRFIEDNWLYKMNTSKRSDLPKEISVLIDLTLQASKRTKGYYDITVLPLLENAGYGISKDQLPENIGYQNIELNGDNIYLHNGVSLDFGSFGKGYIVDYIYKSLEKYMLSGVINFGGDMRVKGSQRIHLEHPQTLGKNIAALDLEDVSIASSSGSRRQLRTGSHLRSLYAIPDTEGVQATYISHKLCTYADIYSTALFVSPFELSCKILEETPGLEGMIIASDGRIFTSSHFVFTPL